MSIIALASATCTVNSMRVKLRLHYQDAVQAGTVIAIEDPTEKNLLVMMNAFGSGVYSECTGSSSKEGKGDNHRRFPVISIRDDYQWTISRISGGENCPGMIFNAHG